MKSKSNSSQGEPESLPNVRLLLYEEWLRSHPSIIEGNASDAERCQSHLELQSLIHFGENDLESQRNSSDHQINTLILQQISQHYHSTNHLRWNVQEREVSATSVNYSNPMSSSMVNTFFQEYPNCCRQPPYDDECRSTTPSESDSEMNECTADCVFIQTVPPMEAAIRKNEPSETTPCMEPRRISPTSTIPSTTNNGGPPPTMDLSHSFVATNKAANPFSNPSSNHSKAHATSTNPYVANPYSHPSSNHSKAQSTTNPYVQAQNPFQTAREVGISQAKARDPPDYDSSWDDVQAQNPFPPAREVTRQPPPYHPSDPALNRVNPYQPQDPPLPPLRPYPQQPHSDPPPPPVPIIRESLKRKFQPPIRRGESIQNTTTNGASSNTVQASRPRSSGGATQVPKENELPEELQMYGPELVAKIENEIMDQTDPITFDDIAGLHEQKQTVYEIVCWPMKRPDLFTGLRAAPNGLLLYGPPGTGKTLIGKAIANESGATFFSISSSSLTSKWIGEGEKLVRVLFAVAAYRQPAVVFIDEIDSLLTQRKSDENEASRRIKTEFLIQMDGTGTSGQGRVLLIGATNRPQELDEAARRRFTKRLYVPLPECPDREALIRVLLKTNAHGLSDNEIQRLALDTDGFSGADLKALCTDAAMGPIRQLGVHALDTPVSEIPPITHKHFRQALRRMKPSVSPQDLTQYIEWDRTYGSSKRADDDAIDDDEEEESGESGGE